ncbi:AraC family transcriptional regulator [Clostridium intestinale]|uniref:AraC family transcriptional regulator n=1 Tax=Clostridium intestinale TaxID=36845 RepID=A0A7D6ZHG3_9CLOT|nr:AraC family transcriptional regulator [Clostridium intestinale]QLY80541.1 AraC family transcriptional regulator [Clostridium intestinale]
MKFKNIFFHIHYCNGRRLISEGRYTKRITRTLQHHELVFVTGGKGTIEIENKKYEIKKGILFYICPGVLHFLEADSNEPICFLSVHFSYTNIDLKDGNWNIDESMKRLPISTVLELKDYYNVEDMFQKLLDSWNGKLPGYEFVTRTLFQQLLIAIYENIKGQNRNYSNSIKVEKVIKYMHEHIDKKVTLAELSEVVQLSSFYLTKIFKGATGYSVIEYFNKMKIDKAKELFIEGNKKVKEVANTLGFTDEFYFSRMFKKLEGISPSEYYNKNIHEV